MDIDEELHRLEKDSQSLYLHNFLLRILLLCELDPRLSLEEKLVALNSASQILYSTRRRKKETAETLKSAH